MMVLCEKFNKEGWQSFEAVTLFLQKFTNIVEKVLTIHEYRGIV
jgi:hypothetical protein